MIRTFILGTALALAASTTGDAHTRYRLATSYGLRGMARDPKPAGEGDFYAIGQQSTGKIVAGGLLWNPNGSLDSAHLMRFNTNGTVDSTFGTNGVWGTQAGFFVQGVRALKMLSGDKFLALGKTVTGGLATGVLVRYNADGSRDMSFNAGAPVVLNASGANLYPTSLALQSDGGILVAANKYFGGNRDSVFIYRFTANGAVDPSFGANGIHRRESYFASDAAGNPARVYVDGQDRIYMPLVASNAQPATMHVLRLTKSGTPDAAFGTSGMSAPVTIASNAARFDLSLMPSGRIVGYEIFSGTPPTLTLSSFRLTSTGQLDNTYGTSGIASFQSGPFPPSSDQHVRAIPNGEHLLMVFATVTDGDVYTTLTDIDTTGKPGTLFGGKDTLQALTLQANPQSYYGLLGIAKLQDNSVYVWGLAGQTFGLIQKFSPMTTGLGQVVNQLEATAFPNPAGDVLKLRCVPGAHYAVYDVTGRDILNGITSGNETTLLTAGLAPGTYTLTCTKDGATRAIMFTKR